jgi:hypothetical protein
MRWVGPAALLTACATLDVMPPDQPCLEAGFAIAARTEECTGDSRLAEARFERFDREYRCVPSGPLHPDPRVQSPDLFHCAFAIRNVPCELAVQYGDDLAAWLASSPVCAIVTAPRGASDTGAAEVP